MVQEELRAIQAIQVRRVIVATMELKANKVFKDRLDQMVIKGLLVQ